MKNLMFDDVTVQHGFYFSLDFFASLEGKSTGWNSNRTRISNRVFHTG